jgi:hypothetical protein
MSSLGFQAPVPIVRNVKVGVCRSGVEDLKSEAFICYAVMSRRNIYMNVVGHHSSKMLMVLCLFVSLLHS